MLICYFWHNFVTVFRVIACCNGAFLTQVSDKQSYKHIDYFFMRKILFFAALMFAVIQATASPVDVRTAQSRAQSFVNQHLYGGKLRAPLSGEMTLAHAEMNSKLLDRAVYYIFNSTNGFVIVSGDDRAEEILGYGDCPLDINNMPCNMKAWLGTYKEQIEYLQAHEGLQVETPSMMAPGLRISSVEPLLTAMWDQEAPYWNQCKFNNTQCLTGCPATSASMVFHYWKYPDFPTPEVPGYRFSMSQGWSGSTTVTVPALPSVTFDWDNMLDKYTGSYTTAQANAVATLMRYVGQAEHMEYGSDGSGVDADSVILIVNAFKLFGYDEETVRMVKKTSSYSGGQTLYTDAEWAAMMQEELSEGRPIVFCAVAGGWFGGGHAFNVDGYDSGTNKYHINWGWSGSYNNYFAINAFNGGGSTYNQYQQMVIGIQPPIKMPRLKTDKNALSMECFKNNTATSGFTLTGRNLEGNVTLTLNDENGVFSIDKNALTPDEDDRVNQAINVTYAPQTEGNYTATITVSTPGVDDIVINLEGNSDYELYRPAMQDVDESTVTATSFRADWTDRTPVENVVSYTLEVRVKPDVCLLTEGDWSNVPKENTNHASYAANYLPDGWTFTGDYFYLDGGFISANRECVLNPNCDLVGYNKVSVIIKAKAYTKGSNTTLTVATDVASETLVLAKEVDTYLVVLEVGAHPKVQFITGYYPEIQSIKIYGGEINDPEPFAFMSPVVNGDAEYCLIEGITPDKFYTVTGLIPATPYLYRVKSLYVNGTESSWSNTKEVLLKETQGQQRGDIDADGIVGINDVTELINLLLSGDMSAVDLMVADCNEDGSISIDDVTSLINYLLQGKW